MAILTSIYGKINLFYKIIEIVFVVGNYLSLKISICKVKNLMGRLTDVLYFFQVQLIMPTSAHCFVPGCSNGGYKLERQYRGKRCPKHGSWFGEDKCDCPPPPHPHFKYVC